MVQRTEKGRAVQAHRHELLSLWLVGADGPLGNRLFAGEDDTVRIAALCAIAGHHLKFTSGLLPYPLDAAQPLTLLASHPDFRRMLAFGSEALALPAAPAIAPVQFDATGYTLEDAVRPTLARLTRTFRSRVPPELRRFVAAVKAVTLAADVVASAVVRGRLGSEDAAAWVAAALASICSSDDLNMLVAARLGNQEPRPFQEVVAASDAQITLVRAGCGSGKTVAAYMWAASHAVGRKLLVSYPTTGTATEGYADYLYDQPVESLLAHSRAGVDLERLRAAAEAPAQLEGVLENGDETPLEVAEVWAAVDRALRVWLPKIVVCTADTVLGLLHNYRGGLFAFPAIAGGAFVFDEIHLYDERMFDTLLRFLDEFRGAPVLLMTASLQPHRLEALERLSVRRAQPLRGIGGPEGLETGKRYRLYADEAEAARERALQTLAAGGKVLWVCNTVDAAMSEADRFGTPGARPLVYHSRFRYEDRVERHRAVVDAFKAPGAVLAVTTQVCEVSLDLSADLLVSEVAPAPAMIQRLGRLNRRFDPDRPQTRPAIFYEPRSHLPYEAADLDAGREWLRQLVGRAVSQRELAEAFEAQAAPPPDGARVTQVWLDGMPFAEQAPLRETEGTVPVILPHEAADCRGARGRPLANEIVRRAIPMPLWAVRDELPRWDRIGMAFVAPPGWIAYAAERGARWIR
jgi:CRISPR-associated endonuclease/helicase Cas3